MKGLLELEKSMVAQNRTMTISITSRATVVSGSCCLRRDQATQPAKQAMRTPHSSSEPARPAQRPESW